MSKHQQRIETIASELFGKLATSKTTSRGIWEHRYTTLTLDDNNAPIIILHDGQGNTLAAARWDGEKWYREKLT